MDPGIAVVLAAMIAAIAGIAGVLLGQRAAHEAERRRASFEWEREQARWKHDDRNRFAHEKRAVAAQFLAAAREYEETMDRRVRADSTYFRGEGPYPKVNGPWLRNVAQPYAELRLLMPSSEAAAADVLASIERMDSYYRPFWEEYGSDDPATERWEELRASYRASLDRLLTAIHKDLGLHDT